MKFTIDSKTGFAAGIEGKSRQDLTNEDFVAMIGHDVGYALTRPVRPEEGLTRAQAEKGFEDSLKPASELMYQCVLPLKIKPLPESEVAYITKDVAKGEYNFDQRELFRTSGDGIMTCIVRFFNKCGESDSEAEARFEAYKNAHGPNLPTWVLSARTVQDYRINAREFNEFIAYLFSTGNYQWFMKMVVVERRKIRVERLRGKAPA